MRCPHVPPLVPRQTAPDPTPKPYRVVSAADKEEPRGSVSIAEPPVDLRSHNAALSGRVVVTAEERTSQELPGSLQPVDLLVQSSEAGPPDRFPPGDSGGMQDPADVVESEPGVLEHPDEDETAEGRLAVAPLARAAGVGRHEAPPLVVPDSGGGHTRSGRDLADRQEGLGHSYHLT